MVSTPEGSMVRRRAPWEYPGGLHGEYPEGSMVSTPEG